MSLHVPAVNETVRANVTEETPLLVLSNLNNDHTYIFTIAAVVFGNGSEIRGPRSESVEFSFSSDSERIYSSGFILLIPSNALVL